MPAPKRSRRCCATPMTVPPVPTPATNAVGAVERQNWAVISARWFLVRLHIGGVVELLGAKHAAGFTREVVRHANGAQKSAPLC